MRLSQIWKRFGNRTLAVVLAGAVGAFAGALASSGALHAADGAPAAAVKAAPAPAPATIPADGFADVISRVESTVVSVYTTKTVTENYQGNPFVDPFFRQFFGGEGPFFQVPRRRSEKGLGSGVIVSSDGYILTNSHVVDSATKVRVTLTDKREFPAKIVGTDPKTDIAVLKIDATGLPVMPFGDSSRVRVGDIVLAIGEPFGVGQTVTMGIVSATSRGNLGIEDYEDFIQTDAAINPGNSGGALINNRGQLIGINTAIIGPSGANNGIGFAIPINLARNVMDQILKHGKVRRGYLGAMVQDVTPAIARQFGVEKGAGALLSDIEPGSAADKAGLKRGDIVTTLNGKPIDSARKLRLSISLTPPGTVVKLGIIRDGQPMEVSVRLNEMPGGSGPAGQGPGYRGALDGVSVDELTPQVARQLGVGANVFGVVVTDVDPDSPAYEAGLRRGDVIEEVNRKPVRDVASFQRAVREAGSRAVLLLVNRGGNTEYVAIEP